MESIGLFAFASVFNNVAGEHLRERAVAPPHKYHNRTCMSLIGRPIAMVDGPTTKDHDL